MKFSVIYCGCIKISARARYLKVTYYEKLIFSVLTYIRYIWVSGVPAKPQSSLESLANELIRIMQPPHLSVSTHGFSKLIFMRNVLPDWSVKEGVG